VDESNLNSVKLKCRKERESWTEETEDICWNCGRNKAHLPDAIHVTQLSLVILVLRTKLQDACELDVIKYAMLDWGFPVHFTHLKNVTTFLSQK
jgi:hypothetical protein